MQRTAAAAMARGLAWSFVAMSALGCGDDAVLDDATGTAAASGVGGASTAASMTMSSTGVGGAGGGGGGASAFGFYGVPWSADALQNWNIGSPKQQRWSYRFRTPLAGELARLRPYFVTNPQDLSNTGYAGGNGGRVRVDLCPDDGTPLHAPDCSTVLGTTEKGDFDLVNGAGKPGFDVRETWFPSMVLNAPVEVEAGALYHAVFTNIDPDPTINWIGLDGMIEFGNTTLAPVRPSTTDWGLLLGTTTSAEWIDWTHNGDDNAIDTPVMGVVYADGTTFGCGYMEVWPSAVQSRAVDAVRSVRETFVASRDLTVNGVGVRVRRTGDTGALGLQLQRANGDLIEEVRIDHSAVDDIAQRWVAASFTASHALTKGEGYHLVLVGREGGSFSANCVRDGQSYGFEAATVFADGHAEFDAGDGFGFLGWYGWSTAGDPSYTDGDLQFYFALE